MPAGAAARARTLTPHRQAALITNVQASSSTAPPVETRLTKMPPSAAPMPNEMLRVMPSSALACCSRPCGATCGTSAVAAGMKNAAAVACSA